MADVAVLDRTYDFILRRLVAESRAPPPPPARADGRRPAELAASRPRSDRVVPPFNNLPTQYRLGVGGEWKWFAQCGLEALAACWAFPGRTVEIKAPCLHCGQPIEVAVRDGRIERAAPATTRFYVSVPVREWRANLVYT